MITNQQGLDNVETTSSGMQLAQVFVSSVFYQIQQNNHKLQLHTLILP